MRTLSRFFMLATALAPLAAGCGARGDADSDSGLVQVRIAEVPQGVRCLRITVDGARHEERFFDVTEGESTVLELRRLPVGEAFFTGEAYDSSCAQRDSDAQPQWASEPVREVLLPGLITDVLLRMHRSGRAEVTVDFVEGEGFICEDGSTATCSDATESALVALVNDARADEGLDPLTCSERISCAARLHSRDMCLNDFVGHTSSDGASYTDRLDAQGVDYSVAYEVIASGATSAEQAFELWSNSPDHLQSLLEPDANRVGIGFDPCASGARWTVVLTD